MCLGRDGTIRGRDGTIRGGRVGSGPDPHLSEAEQAISLNRLKGSARHGGAIPVMRGGSLSGPSWGGPSWRDPGWGHGSGPGRRSDSRRAREAEHRLGPQHERAVAAQVVALHVDL